MSNRNRQRHKQRFTKHTKMEQHERH